MKTYKVRELTGVLLDAAVAKAEGLVLHFPGNPHQYPDGWKTDAQGEPYPWRPHLDWAISGPLVEREAIRLKPVFFEDLVEVEPFTVDYWDATDARTGRRYQGSKPLIAAMRAYVASKFGETVELP